MIFLFDCDGVIILGEQFSKFYSNKYDVPIEKMLPFFTGPFKECIIGAKDLKEELQPYLHDWNWNDGVDRFLDLWFNSEFVINEELIKFIENNNCHNKFFMVTNNEKYRTGFLEKNMSEYFTKIYSSSMIGEKKPNKRFYLEVLKDIGVKAEDIVYFDDEEINVEAANELGINAFLFKASQTEESIKIMSRFIN
ncbi:HAD-IA family hydrolase [Candidatus Woesearchaeota archaeon]|nr:HAD-IA family hydrolase [Candidatus Woesearchaeota archaeon]